MSFKDSVAELAKRALNAQAVAQTEEATKNAIVMPFLRVLGFDVFDPTQVIPEYIADIGLKKGEKIDYAVKIGDKIEYLVEAKSISTSLQDAQYSQLFRYFHTLDADIAILTNGLNFWFFTDLDAPNKMDQKPFFRFDLLSYDENDIKELEKFHKDQFSIENIRAAASSLKYLRAAMSYIEAQWEKPEDEFVKLVARDFYESNVTSKVIESMRPIVKRAFDDLFRQRVHKRLTSAFDDNQNDTIPVFENADQKDNKVETTEEELQGFMIVRAIAAEVTQINRITARDAQSYFAILFDDNNRKPVARLYFNGKTKFITVFDPDKNAQRFDISKVEDIFAAREPIRSVVQSYV